ncbi:hypothetical protein [Nocardia sp. NPDC049707]|uniref:hypothetical protein n=1 Tax=Nocardia sp. NPDC049707 TaxID=3154735 RepID=UPI00341DDFFA
MSVDMFERRFRQELMRVPEFTPNDTRDPRAWPRPNSSEGEFPAWRALFDALCLYGHSTGYQLFSFEKFLNQCEKAYTVDHPSDRFQRYFTGDLRDGMIQRVGVWYEAGMAETYLYVCLVEALEDHAKAGIVLYDPRADWKLKADTIVTMNGRTMRVSGYTGETEDRAGIEQRRDGIERERKRNTAESAHWDNAALASMPTFDIALNKSDAQVVNGCRLFKLSSINDLLDRLYDYAEVASEIRWTFPLRS